MDGGQSGELCTELDTKCPRQYSPYHPGTQLNRFSALSRRSGDRWKKIVDRLDTMDLRFVCNAACNGRPSGQRLPVAPNERLPVAPNAAAAQSVLNLET